MTPSEARRRTPAVPNPLIPAECSCGNPATRYDAVNRHSWCFWCAVAVFDSRTHLAHLFTDAGGVLRIDRDRMGGGVVCESCGFELYDHPPCPGAEYLVVLCDGSVAKL